MGADQGRLDLAEEEAINSVSIELDEALAATATISVHQGVDAPDEPLFRACEEVFAAHEGRPHWGKVHYRSGDELASLYPRYGDWWRVRDRYDPVGLFLNPHLSSLRP